MLSKGSIIKHKIFGEGEVVDITGEPMSLDSKVVVKFASENKTFKLGAMKPYFNLDNETINLIDSLTEIKDGIEAKKRQRLVSEIKDRRPKPKKLLEFCDNVDIEEWKKLLDCVNDHRFIYQNRAIVVDKKVIYPSTVIALVDLGKDVSLSELVYGACDMNKGRGSEFDGVHYRYATALEIESVIERLEDVDA